MQARYLESLTWQEAELALYELPTVLVPLGARTKEHGHHLPLNNDWLIAEYLARRVAKQCPVLVVPTVQYGYYPAFLEYPGSISIRSDACRDALIDICCSLAAQGARRFYVLNTGISTIKPLGEAREAIIARGVRMDRAQRDIHPDRGPGGLRRDPKAPSGIHSPTGAYGDPTLASVEKGKHVVEGMVSYLVQQVQSLSAEHVRRPPATLPSG